MTNLWFDLDEMEDEKDDDLYEKEDFDTNLVDSDLDDIDIFCEQCAALVEDGFQCEICGWMVEI
jgi:hypothetical protein